MRVRTGREARGERNWTLDLDRRGRATPAPLDREAVRTWCAARIPAEWAARAIEVSGDDHEILLVAVLDAGPDDGVARVEAFREATREARAALGKEAEERFARKLTWGARAAGVTRRFSNPTVPVVTRLALPQRLVLDALVGAGIARNRGEALAWCVELVARNEREWVGELREALGKVEQVKAVGPASLRDR